METENTFIITTAPAYVPVKYLRHEGHKHYWTTDRSQAMEYSKLEVAQKLAEKMGGIVEAL